MKLLLVSATPFEIAPTKEWLELNAILNKENQYQFGILEIELLITGIGIMATAFHLGQKFQSNQYDLVINAGIAGSFKKEYKIGTVVNVISEQIGDLGAEDADGNFSDIFEMKLTDKNESPFQNGILNNIPATSQNFLPHVRALSVNKVHGSKKTIDKIIKKYNPDIESMEGAAFFYACLLKEISFLEIRAISNFVEPRNKSNWNIPLAIKELNKTLQEITSLLNV